jgi:hypothetical protein
VSDLQVYSVEKVKALVAQIQEHPERIFIPSVRHIFGAGMYQREMFMPAGSLVVGKRHLREHLITVLGKVLIHSPVGTFQIDGYQTWVSEPGDQRSFLALEDSWITTTHTNEDDCQDLAVLDSRNVTSDF